jgi:predicted nucleic acid-binding protein
VVTAEVARASLLADTSVFARLGKPDVAAAFAPLVARGEVAMCAPVAFELGFSARSLGDHRMITERLAAFDAVPVGNGDHLRALEIQAALAERGAHRAVSLVDALVAAAAETRSLTVLHYDADFELISSVTGQPHRWIVERGTSD